MQTLSIAPPRALLAAGREAPAAGCRLPWGDRMLAESTVNPAPLGEIWLFERWLDWGPTQGAAFVTERRRARRDEGASLGAIFAMAPGSLLGAGLLLCGLLAADSVLVRLGACALALGGGAAVAAARAPRRRL